MKHLPTKATSCWLRSTHIAILDYCLKTVTWSPRLTVIFSVIYLQDTIARRGILCPLHVTLAITVLITSCLATGPSHAHDFTIEISLGLNRWVINFKCESWCCQTEWVVRERNHNTAYLTIQSYSSFLVTMLLPTLGFMWPSQGFYPCWTNDLQVPLFSLRQNILRNIAAVIRF